MAIWWGHDTLEDKAARKQKEEESRVRMIFKQLPRITLICRDIGGPHNSNTG